MKKTTEPLELPLIKIQDEYFIEAHGIFELYKRIGGGMQEAIPWHMDSYVPPNFKTRFEYRTQRFFKDFSRIFIPAREVIKNMMWHATHCEEFNTRAIDTAIHIFQQIERYKNESESI